MNKSLIKQNISDKTNPLIKQPQPHLIIIVIVEKHIHGQNLNSLNIININIISQSINLAAVWLYSFHP